MKIGRPGHVAGNTGALPFAISRTPNAPLPHLSSTVRTTQWAAFSYLARANRFSRSPSHVAEFMASTRGTVSQTLKALARKSLIEEVRSETDRRWISYAVASKGREALDRSTVIDAASENLLPSTAASLSRGLQLLVRSALKAGNRKPFGICKTCRYNQPKGNGGFCLLLNEVLAPEEVLQICCEHEDG